MNTSGLEEGSGRLTHVDLSTHLSTVRDQLILIKKLLQKKKVEKKGVEDEYEGSFCDVRCVAAII